MSKAISVIPLIYGTWYGVFYYDKFLGEIFKRYDKVGWYYAACPNETGCTEHFTNMEDAVLHIYREYRTYRGC